MRIGIHTSISGSLEKAALKAHELGANTFQIFSSSPRQWKPSRPDAADIGRLSAARAKYDLTPLAIHDSYLINLASCEPTIRAQSIAAFRGEIERALAIGADYLVMHPGNCKGQPIEQGMRNVVDGLAEAATGLTSDRLTILFENTVGNGGQLGSRFEELAALRAFASERMGFALGYCLDTCHCFASGNYDISSVGGLKATLAAIDAALGLEHVRVFHANDSKGVFGSKLDRHENIGEGRIGADGFARILQHPRLQDKAFILETPVDNPGDDRRNVDALKTLSHRPKRVRRPATL